MEIHEKLKSCDKQIQFLESLYVQRELQQKIPLTGVERIQFIIKDQNIFGEMGYGPSELFARYIFTIVFSKIKNEKANVSKEKSISDRFYEDKLFNNMNNSFKDWKELLQFWFVYVLLIQQLFKKEANVDELLQQKKLFELARKIRALKSKEERKKDKKGKKGKKGKKQRGGGDLLNEKFSKFKGNKQKIIKNNKKNSASNIYKEFMKKIVIRRKNKNQDLYSYFNGKDFQQAIGEYYEYEGKIDNPTCNLQLPYIGDELEKFSIKLIMNCDKKRHGEDQMNPAQVKQKLEDRITIFQTLYAYNAQNQSDIQRFLSSLYDEVLYFYFMIYYKKKFIYMRYLEIFKSVLRQKGISYEGWVQNKNQQPNQKQNTNIEKENIPNNQKNSSNQNKNKSNENQQNRYASLSPNQISKVKEIESKIKVLEQKREELEKNRHQPNVDKKILLIEKYIHELILEKRKFY